MNDESLCPCDAIVHPRSVENPPGQDTITYRAGDFASFRDALLRAREGEQDIASWRPGTKEDLALQLVEWWAYLADILTFYNERIANDSYMRTAPERGAVARLASLLGYRPRPALGATGKLIASIAGPKAITLPVGFPIQSKPAGGKPPEVFELDVDAKVQPFSLIDVDVAVDVLLTHATTVFLQGGAKSLSPGQIVLFIKKNTTISAETTASAIIKSVSYLTDARGRKYRQVVFMEPVNLPLNAMASEYDFMTHDGELKTSGSDKADVDESTGSPYHTVVTREKPMYILPGDIVLLKGGQFNSPRIMSVAMEVGQATEPTKDYTRVRVQSTVDLGVYAAVLTVRIYYGFVTGERIICDPATAIHVPVGATDAERTHVVAPTALCYPSSATAGIDVMIQDVTGRVAIGTVVSTEIININEATVPKPSGNSSDPAVAMQLTLSKVTLRLQPDTAVDLEGPLRLLFGLLPISRGQTVPKEVLGSGDATQENQTFTLKKSPLTYLATTDPAKSEGYASTLRVLVDGVAWTEVESFYDQAPDAQVYVLREDDDQKTHVLFGDGVIGSRLPTGVSNIVASYRFGAGASAPEAGSIITPMKAYPGLKSVQNPVAAGGGSDPDSARLVRRYAPRSALTLGRAVSEDDYETIAGRAPGVTRARALFDWDASLERALVVVFVDGGESAVESAGVALTTTADPDRPFRVAPAVAVPGALSLRLIVHPRYDADAVKASVEKSLLDPDLGLFRPEITRIGGPIYDSWLYEACLRTAGVVAVHDLTFSHAGPPQLEKHYPGKNGFFTLSETSVNIKIEVATHAD
jgi:Baseplate J-like protein